MKLWNRIRLRAGHNPLDDEIRLHREMLEEQFMREGMSRDEAARAAAQQFGNTAYTADQSRDEWTFPRIDTVLKDVRFAVRLMLRHPLLTAAAILTVAFGVGANTAILSVLETVLLHPLGMGDADRVMVARVSLETLHMPRTDDSGAEFQDLSSMTDAFSAVAATEGREWTFQQDGQATRLLGRAVTPDFFRVFSIHPAAGRFFNADDRQSVVLSYAMWRTQFGGDASALGRTVTFDDKPYHIVGVAPQDFRFPADAMAWTPLVLSPERLKGRGNNMVLMVFARLRDGISPEQAANRVDRYVAGFEDPDLKKLRYSIVLDPFSVYLSGELRRPLWLLWAAALVVLLTGCANIAGLLLTRAAGRRKEIAIRLSVGATRWQVVRQLLLESLMLGLAGGAAGLLLARLAVPLMANVSVPGKKMLALVSLDGRLLAYGIGLAIVSSLIFGLVPALQLLRNSQTTALARNRRRWFQDLFVTAEVAGAFVLVVMTVLLLRSLWAVEQIQPGFDVRHVTTAFFTKPKNDPGFLDRLETNLRATPGVETAALAYPLPFGGGGLTSRFNIRNRERQPGEPEWHGEAWFVSPNYLPALRIPLLRGRNFDASDSAKAPVVCIVDRKMADTFFPGEDPIGHEIAMYRGWARIVGVASTVRSTSLEVSSRPVVYYPLVQVPFFPQAAAVVRSTLPAGNVIREAVRRTNSTVPVFEIHTMEERIGATLGVRRVLATLLSLFGGMSLLLALIGIYGVVAQVVSECTQEVGIRMALGARPLEILRGFLAQGLRAGLLGLVLGAVAAAYAQRWLKSMLFEVRGFDPATFAGAAAVILVLLALAVWWPARRASRIDPQIALRYE